MVVAAPEWKEEERRGLLDSVTGSPTSPPLDEVKLELGYYAADDEKRVDVLPQERDPKSGSIRLVVWMTVNIIATVAIVFTNKSILSNASFRHSQVSFAAYHFTITGLTLWLASRPFCGWFEPKHVSPYRILHLVAAMCIQVIFQNLALAYSSVIFHQLARLLLTPATALLNYTLFQSSIPKAAFLPLVLLCAGVGIVSYFDSLPSAHGNDTTTPEGIFFALSGVCASALYTVLVGRYHKKLEMSSMQLLLNQAPASAAVLLCVVPWMETFPEVSSVPGSLWVSILASGIFACLVNLSQFYIIDAAGPVTSTVIGQLKTCIIVGLGWVLSDHEIMRQSIAGILMALAGMSFRRRFQLTFILTSTIAFFYLFHLNILPTDYEAPFKPRYARTLSARDLLSRPLSQDLTTIPKIIHQTWFPAGTNMSEDAQAWVQTMRSYNPDWEYVLWDDETNRMLVEEYFPWFLTDYNRLPKEIHRADVVRNLYMYLFGGMYADVDTEALRPVEPLFTGHATSLAKHTQILSSGPRKTPDNTQRGFVGHMAHKEGLDGPGAVPNGWMASPPGHPFWLLPVIHVIDNPNGNGDGSVEGLTGPGALGDMLHKYYENFTDSSVRVHVCQTVRRWSPGWGLYCGPEGEEAEVGARADKMVVLPRQQIYPYSWADDKYPACLAAWGNPEFDPEECKRWIDVEEWPSYFITYCTHSW
ncbi:integral membrane protein [Aspergillus sclerotiicarbonarius CBS 121057]|uniref:Integral membrane protein n=1 Tax=Aspergillus sclerotiicarbonarius (strain CBS 121057 / IBT 28362) TaxID=1448318 RepID=A0A319DSH8_ASPSB|nr:integral membrane protein [Aspergillus sclerotiicarbonarius CBS 121057]